MEGLALLEAGQLGERRLARLLGGDEPLRQSGRVGDRLVGGLLGDVPG